MPPKPPVKQITNLKQIDISKMDINDLQNINYEKLFKDIRQKPDKIIGVSACLLAVFLSFNIFNKTQTKKRAYQIKTFEMEEKSKIIDEFNTAQADLKNFLTSVPPKLTENEFINKITDIAVSHNVKIDSFSKNEDNTLSNHSLISLEISALVSTYEDLYQFINDIETANSSIRVNSWSGNLSNSNTNYQRRAEAASPESASINFRINISLVTFKE